MFLSYSAKGLTRNGVVYKTGCVVRVPPRKPDSFFSFAVIDSIVIANNLRFFVVRYVDICGFDDHFYSYEVKRSSETGIVSSSSLVRYDALVLRKIAGRLLVTENLPVVVNIPGL